MHCLLRCPALASKVQEFVRVVCGGDLLPKVLVSYPQYYLRQDISSFLKVGGAYLPMDGARYVPKLSKLSYDQGAAGQ